MKTENDEILKCLTNSLREVESKPPPESVDFRQMEVRYLCLGKGAEGSCSYGDLTDTGECRMQVNVGEFITCLRRF